MTWDFQHCGMCDQQSLRSTCAYVQSDQSLCSSIEYSISVRLLIEHLLEAPHARLSLHLSKCHIIGNHMPWLNIAIYSSDYRPSVNMKHRQEPDKSPTQIKGSNPHLTLNRTWGTLNRPQRTLLPRQLVEVCTHPLMITWDFS